MKEQKLYEEMVKISKFWDEYLEEEFGMSSEDFLEIEEFFEEEDVYEDWVM